MVHPDFTGDPLGPDNETEFTASVFDGVSRPIGEAVGRRLLESPSISFVFISFDR